MFKLVVLSALLALAASAPHHIAAPVVGAYAYGAPAVSSVSSYSYAAAAPAVAYAAAPAVVAAPAPAVHYKTVAAPAVQYQAYAAPAVVAAPVPAVHYKTVAAPAIAYAAAPAVQYQAYAAPVATAITKTVHYESKPVVTGYSSSIIKPDLGHIATPLNAVTQQRVLAPARSVQTITPQITQVQPEVSVQRVAVDVPVNTPYVSEVEVRTPTVVAPAPVAYAAPAVHYAAAPAVAYKSYAAPAVAYGAAPAVAYGGQYAYGAGLGYAYGAAPAAVAYKQAW